MRGWVGVQNEKEQKRLYSPSIQAFEGNHTFKPSAHPIGTAFQRFSSFAMTIMICLLAQPYIENQIQQRFQLPGVAINLNPY